MFLNALNTFHNKVHGSLHEVIHMVGVDSWGKFGPSYEVGKPAHLPQPPILSSRIEAYVFIRGDLPTNGASTLSVSLAGTMCLPSISLLHLSR